MIVHFSQQVEKETLPQCVRPSRTPFWHSPLFRSLVACTLEKTCCCREYDTSLHPVFWKVVHDSLYKSCYLKGVWQDSDLPAMAWPSTLLAYGHVHCAL